MLQGKLRFLVLAMTIFCLMDFGTAIMQRVVVTGRLNCGGQPAKNVRVRLYDGGEQESFQRDVAARC